MLLIACVRNSLLSFPRRFLNYARKLRTGFKTVRPDIGDTLKSWSICFRAGRLLLLEEGRFRRRRHTANPTIDESSLTPASPWGKNVRDGSRAGSHRTGAVEIENGARLANRLDCRALSNSEAALSPLLKPYKRWNHEIHFSAGLRCVLVRT